MQEEGVLRLFPLQNHGNRLYYIIYSIELEILFLLGGCVSEDIQPWLSNPGYRTKLIFQDTFENDLTHWETEGEGIATITQDGKLHLTLTPESNGFALWLNRDFSKNFQLEYEVEIPETSGTVITFICTEGSNGEDILKDLPQRYGMLNQYIEGQIKSYHITYHCYNKDGQHITSSQMRKNPGSLLLSRSSHDPCGENRTYFLDIVKLDNRIQFFVDGKLEHDVRDKGGFGPIYHQGKIGFHISGLGGLFTIILDNVRLFKLIPK